MLRLADAGRAARPEQAGVYIEAAARLVRALTIDGGVEQAVRDGRRAVALAEAGADEILTAALAAYARALFFAGELDEAWAVALRTLEHPAHRAARPEPGGRTIDARPRRRRARPARLRARPRREGESRGGPDRHEPKLARRQRVRRRSASVLAAEGSLVEAEHELASAERFFRDEVATLHHTWLLVAPRARPRSAAAVSTTPRRRCVRRGRRSVSWPTAGASPRSPARSQRELEAARRPRGRRGAARAAERAPSSPCCGSWPRDLSTREIGERLFLSPNTIRSHTRALYRKLGVHSRTDAIARATALGLLEQTESPG